MDHERLREQRAHAEPRRKRADWVWNIIGMHGRTGFICASIQRAPARQNGSTRRQPVQRWRQRSLAGTRFIDQRESLASTKREKSP